MDAHGKDKFIRLVGDRYNKETDEVTLTSDRWVFCHLEEKLAAYDKTKTNKTNTQHTRVLAKGKHFLPLIRHPSCYSYGWYVLDTTICNKHKC